MRISIYIFIYIYMCIYMYIYIYINQMCVSRYGIKIKSHHHLREFFAMVCSESQRLHHCHMCVMTHSYVCHDSFICVPWLILKSKTASLPYVHPPSLFAPALSAHSSPVRQFECVSFSMYIYTHTSAWRSPTHTNRVLVCVCVYPQHR